MINILLDKKLIILGSGDNTIRFRPHLNVKTEDIDLAYYLISETSKSMLN
jgi:acetylornithine/succinyldiaminopimelate/putrescine aminotransferase